MIKYFNGIGKDVRFFKSSDCSYNKEFGIYSLKDDSINPYFVIPNNQELKVFKIIAVVDSTIDWEVPVTANRICCGIQALPEEYNHFIISKEYYYAYKELGFVAPKFTFFSPVNKVYNNRNLLIGYQGLVLY
jgi:hypothetical protein